MLTVRLVLFLAMLLFAMGALQALIVAEVRQIIDEIEIRESQRSGETAPESGPANSQPSQSPIAPGRN